MGMSPRLLRPRASSALVATDADAKAYINAVRTADGGQYMEAGVQRAIDAFVIGCKADGIWTAIKASCLLMGARTLSGALTPLVGAAPTNNGPFVSGDYNRKTGLAGDGVGKYLDSNRNCNADPQDSFHMCVYVHTFQNETDKALMGAGGNATGSSQFAASGQGGNGTNGCGFRCRNTTQQIISNSAAAGLVGVSRSSSANYIARAAQTDTTVSAASETPFNGNIMVFARLSAVSVVGLYGPHRLRFYSIGQALTLSTLEARLATLTTAIGAAIP